jgi:hypothetical protein
MDYLSLSFFCSLSIFVVDYLVMLLLFFVLIMFVKALGREIRLDRVNVLLLQVGVGLQELDAQPRACKGLP